MEQEKAEMELLEQHNINFIVLARYMQVISEQMIEAYPNRCLLYTSPKVLYFMTFLFAQHHT